MSLIADALRKGGQGNLNPPPPPRPSRFGWFYGILLLGAIGLAVTALPRHRSQQSMATISTVQEKQTATAQAIPKQTTGLNLLRVAEGQWRLNGTIRGGQGESLALINGQVVAEGSTIQGAKVVRVAQDQVELESGNGQVTTLKLR